MYQPTNAFNKIQPNTNHKIQFMTSITVPHVSGPEWHLQGVY